MRAMLSGSRGLIAQGMMSLSTRPCNFSGFSAPVTRLFSLHHSALTEMKGDESDSASFANCSAVSVTRFHLEWNVLMEEKQLVGSVRHSITAKKPGQQVILDARDLKITSVLFDGASATFSYAKVNDALGDKLVITLPKMLETGETGSLLIAYSTSPSALALQWLAAEQTTDRRASFLFSQCQAIHARSIMPCMDTPGVKAAYTAKVSVPSNLTCLMSGIQAGESKEENGRRVFNYEQAIPIPSYLVAIVAGVLERRVLSDRCAVWAEPSVVAAAADEFEPTEKFLTAAEDICGEYVWKRYDLVVLPATFPYGGMENPCLTFVTPTIIAGDRSLVNVVAHEIAHSWTGNLVTNCNWDHFWLNEGFTVYTERRILEKLSGPATRIFDSYEGFQLGCDTIRTFPVAAHTKLRQELGGIDPDDAFSRVPYEKGSALLLYIEQNVLSPEERESFLKEHVKAYADVPLCTERWLDDMLQKYPKLKEHEEVVRKWIYDEGVPPAEPSFAENSLLCECTAVVAELAESAAPSPSPFSSLSSVQKSFVLDSLRSRAPLPEEKMSLLSSAAFGIASSGNCELQLAWLQLGMTSKWLPIIPAALAFAEKYGRLKYCKKMYSLLFDWEESRAAAIEQFDRTIPFMHPITVQQIRLLLKTAQQKQES